MTPLVTVACPECGQTARIPGSATVQATCNAHEQHHHRRGVLMVAAAIDTKETT